MSWFNFGVEKEIDAIGDTVEKTGTALDNLFTSDEERLTHKELMARIEQKPAQWAHELNLINAKSSSWFNSGWRPALGWVGALGMALYFLPQYVLGAILWTQSNWGAQELSSYPVSSDGLWELVALLVGGIIARSADKRNGVSS